MGLYRAGALSACVAALIGCAAVGVPATADPAAKLDDAANLMDQQDRPVPAERLIREAIEIYRANDDQLGLARAYSTYGFFFRSRAVEGKWSSALRKHGFQDTSATYDTRYAKSIEYFNRARTIYSEREQFDALTNIDLNLGFTYVLMADLPAACSAFGASALAFQENARRNPGTKQVLPEGFSSFESFFSYHKARDGCT
jgi:tetratricopeptide (TPR) repeat protein